MAQRTLVCFSPVCIIMSLSSQVRIPFISVFLCIYKFPYWLKLRPHSLCVYGFSPVWIILYCLRFATLLNYFLQKITLVRLFSCVDYHMFYQIMRATEYLTVDRTFVGFLLSSSYSGYSILRFWPFFVPVHFKSL